MKEVLARMPYWKALTLVLAGGAALLWLQSQIGAAVTTDNSRDDAIYAPREAVQDLRERLVRVEEKIDLLIRRK
jgi:hypothetical protein